MKESIVANRLAERRTIRAARAVLVRWFKTDEGKRYLQNDSVGTPFVDLRTGRVSIRERRQV